MNAATKPQETETEQAKTVGGPLPAAAAPMVMRSADPLVGVTGAYRQSSGITERLAWASENAHLISPANVCAILPDGCSVSITAERIDVDADTHDVGGGRRALLKHALHAIANAAGVRWDTDRSCRVDDGSDSRFCHWRAVGAFQNLDGTVLPIVGDRVLDLREGSDESERIMEDAIASALRNKKTAEEGAEAGRTQLRALRSRIVEHAQTKAELRAIRKHLKIRSYTREELNKPFVVARLTFDGYSDDPQARAENRAAIRSLMLGGARALFGDRAADALAHAPASALPSAAPATRHAPPPVGSVPADRDSDGDITTSGTEIEPPGVGVPVATAAAPHAPAEAPFAPPPAAAKAPRAPSGGATYRFGKQKNEPLTAGTVRDLEWYAKAVGDSVNDPERARFRAANQKHLVEIQAELSRRGGAPAPAARPPATRSYDDPYASEREDDDRDNPEAERW